MIVSRRALAMILAFAGLFVLAAGSGSWGWGLDGHSIINRNAIQVLPKELRPFYTANSGYIVSFSGLPDDWRVTHREERSNQHYIDLDLIDQPPFDKIRGERSEVEARLGKEEVAKAGILPWVIEEHYRKLVEAMRAKNAEAIVLQSAVISHFIGDANVPFHATKHYDGKKPEQKGIHFRWESNLLALHLEPEMVRANTCAKVTNVRDAVFDWCTESLGYVDAICAADDKAREKDPNHGYRYFEILRKDTMDIATERLTKAAEDLAGVWVAAWEEAGKPELKDDPADMLWDKR